MIRRIFWEVAAACALVWLGTYGVNAILSLDDTRARLVRAEAQLVALAASAPLISPIRCDATVQQCTTTNKCQKPKCYVRRDR